jgi:hypothetical protein
MRAGVLALFALAGALAAPGPAHGEDIEPAGPALTLTLAHETVEFGAGTGVSGYASGVAPGSEVAVETWDGTEWVPAVAVPTGPDGSFTVDLQPRVSTAVRARLPGTDVASAVFPLAVQPTVAVLARPGRAFVGAKVVVHVRPWSYKGRIVVSVRRGGQEVARTVGLVLGGRLVLRVPTPGVGRFVAVLDLRPYRGLAARTVAVPLRATARRLELGAAGADVRALATRLRELRYHVLPGQASFDERLADAVVAFQKAEGLDRTGVVDETVWRRLAVADTPRPRYVRPADHLEVDKTRQILIVVRDGEVAGVIPVSSGATGNTPEGAFAIRWKAPSTTTWLGPGLLYRTMTFYGNSFAIHGYPSVPPYPASHGCVRVPIWIADWLYDQTPVGQRVFVYRT